MVVVIQCASGKHPNAGHLRTADGSSVLFVANPKAAPPHPGRLYAKPDDDSGSGTSWRDLLIRYNTNPATNQFGLLCAWQLYTHPTYALLQSRFAASVYTSSPRAGN